MKDNVGLPVAVATDHCENPITDGDLMVWIDEPEELSSSYREEIRRHVMECAPCKLRADAWEATKVDDPELDYTRHVLKRAGAQIRAQRRQGLN